MNFKKYHVSKNLFDGTLIGGVFTDADWTISPTVSATTFKSIKVYLSAGTYTFGFEIPVNIVRTVIDGQYAQAYDTNLTSYTITTTTDGYVGISFRANASSTEPWDNSNIMLNTGSQPLPYEPYGNTWTDTPHYIHNTSTDTLTTLPADIYANDTTATVGLKGQMVQSSTPSPTTPIQPSECGERTNNLLRLYKDGYALDEFGTEVENPDFCIYEATVETDRLNYLLTGGTQYGRNIRVHEYDGSTWVSQIYVGLATTLPFIIAKSSNTNIIRVSAYKLIPNMMLAYGSQPLPYEPYGIKIPILSANTTTPVYLGEVSSTRQIKKLKLLSSFRWNRVSNGAFYTSDITDYLFDQRNIVRCSHFESQINTTGTSSVNDNKVAFYYNSAQQQIREFYVAYRSITSLDEFKAFLDNNDVYVWYVLATEETGIVNEPLRKIGDYADEVSGITIPTIAGANTLSIGTTLQPSEVTVNYKGWHPVADVHERENGAWD